MGFRLLRDVVRPAILLWAVATGPAVAQSTAGTATESLPFEETALYGDFASESCEVQPDALPPFKRTYHFTPDGTFQAERTLFADTDCQSPLVTVRLTGTYHLGPTSPRVADARQAELTFATLHMTPHDEKFMKERMGNCGAAPWAVKVEQDVGATGCLTFQPLAKCNMDYDIVQLRGNVIYPGVRPKLGTTPDMCTAEGRPHELQPTGAKRQS